MDALFVLLSSSCWTVFLLLLSSVFLLPSLSMPPSSPSLSSENIHQPWLSLKPPAHKHRPNFFCCRVTFSLFFPLTLFCVSFFFLFCSTVVTVSVLFSFNLNTFQLCMNQALINLIMFRHANVTKLPLCYIMCVCHIETFHMFMWGG